MQAWSQLSLRRKLELLAAALALPVIIALVVLLNASFQLKAAFDERVRYRDFLADLTNLKIAMLNIETGQRGYALSGTPDFLEPYTLGLQQARYSIKRLIDRKLYSESVSRLEVGVNNYLDNWIKPGIAQTDSGQTLTKEEQVAFLRTSKSRFDQLRKLLDTMDEAARVRFNQSQEASLSILRWIGNLSWGILAVVILAILVLRSALDRTIVGRLIRLQGAITLIAQGDYQSRVLVRGGDEVSQLGTSFNLMAASLEKTRHDLQRARERAELLASLTDALQSANTTADVAQIAITGLNQYLGASYMFVNELQGGVLKFTGWAGDLPLDLEQTLTNGIPLEASPEAKQVIQNRQPFYDYQYFSGERQAPGYPPLGLAIKPIRSPDGKIFGILSAIRPSEKGDWTEAEREFMKKVAAAVGIAWERSQNQAALKAANSELERSNQELEQFAYVASHDLQEPLRMISSYTQLLARRYQGQLDDKADQYIHFAVDGANRMQRLIQDLLAYSRVGTRGKPPEPTEASEVLPEVLEGLEVAIQESGAEVVVHPLPRVLADRTQLAQVLQNLVGNALKYRHHGRTPRVEVGAEPGETMSKFYVADNGIGIEPEYHQRIFVIFQRLHSKEDYPGSGIGLAIVKKIVERHGGQVGLESTSQGSRFWFTWPTA